MTAEQSITRVVEIFENERFQLTKMDWSENGLLPTDRYCKPPLNAVQKYVIYLPFVEVTIAHEMDIMGGRKLKPLKQS